MSRLIFGVCVGSSLVNIRRSWDEARCSDGNKEEVQIISSRNSIVSFFSLILYSKSCKKNKILKVSKFRKQILLFSFEPKNEQNYFLISALASEYGSNQKNEGTDAFVISPNRQTLLFSWAWILKLWHFKGLKSCHKRAWSGSEGSNKVPFGYLSLQSCFRLLFDMSWVL